MANDFSNSDLRAEIRARIRKLSQRFDELSQDRLQDAYWVWAEDERVTPQDMKRLLKAAGAQIEYAYDGDGGVVLEVILPVKHAEILEEEMVIDNLRRQFHAVGESYDALDDSALNGQALLSDKIAFPVAGDVAEKLAALHAGGAAFFDLLAIVDEPPEPLEPWDKERFKSFIAESAPAPIPTTRERVRYLN